MPATGPGGIPRRQGPHEEAEAVHEFRSCVAHQRWGTLVHFAGRGAMDIEHLGEKTVAALRNRIAHHEPVFMRDLRAEYARVLRVVRWHDRKTAAWMHGAQSVVDLLAQKP